MYNNYLQDTAIKISNSNNPSYYTPSYNNLKIIDMMVYIKCRLLLKLIISVFYSFFSQKNINLKCF